MKAEAADFKVSVLVTFYNQEKYVDKALESIVSQETDFNVKIMVGDDGSSDRTRDIVNEWIVRYPGRIELYVMQRDSGPHTPGFRASRNRLELLKKVNTEYFIYLDGDDYFTSADKLQRQADILDKEENRDCIACGHNSYRLYTDGRKDPATDPGLPECKLTASEFWKKHYIHTDTLMIRSWIKDLIDYRLLENSFNDVMITYSAVQYGKIYYYPEYQSVYLQTNNGIWTGGDTVVNMIRVMMFYDIALMINPKMKYQSLCRFGFAWEELFKVKRSIDTLQLGAYINEAKEKGLRTALRWCSYQRLKVLGKMALHIEVLRVKCTAFFFRRFISL